ncbi:alkaline phosphatase family protein [Geminicoccus flavidas]|uniref:sulfatase-like hydrolase/transferase n=1 Tax=Geminicoccus flavidas TaxID=2506407 RepID=UPI001359931E|nr:sulfatase-like hydrolase/transferase [Geminicoccus flavidas]
MKILCQLVAAGLFAFALCLLPAIAVHAPNAGQFSAPAWAVLAPFALAFLLVWAVMALLGLVTGWSRHVLVACLAATVVLLLFSQIFGHGEGMVLDGARHSLSVPPVRAAVELAVIALVLAAAWFGRRRIAEHARSVVAILCLWVAASALVPAQAYWTQPRADAGSGGRIPITELSSDFNVIHVMFDSLRSDALAEVLAAYPELRRHFDGFTVYPEHMGYSNWTTISLGGILAQHFYFDETVPPDEPANALFGRWLAQDSLPARLHAAGFQISAMPPGGVFCEGAPHACAMLDHVAAEEGVAIEAGEPAAVLASERILLGNLSLLRLVPAVLKPAVYREGALLIPARADEALPELTPIQRDVVLSREVARHLANNYRVATERPVYQFLHFYPPHRPFLFDADCRLRQEAADDWQSYLDQATCAVRLFGGLVERLRTLGVLERSVVVLQSDTGLNVVPDGEPGPPVTRTEAYGQNELMGYARPALAIKPLGASGAMTVEQRPTHHRDSFALLEAAAMGPDGRSRLDLPDPPSALDGSRPFVVSGPMRPHTRRLAPYERFAVNGPAGEWASWRAEGSFTAPGERLAEARPITAVALRVEPSGPLTPGQMVRLQAKVTGGSGQPVFTFFRRAAEGKFAMIAPADLQAEVEWVVAEDHRRPCQAELLVAARNELDPEDQRVVGELAVPLAKPGC